MLHTGDNEFHTVPVFVERKRVRCINLRMQPDGGVHVSIPYYASLRETEQFLCEKWRWVLKKRKEILSRPSALVSPVSQEEIDRLIACLDELCREWTVRVNEPNVTWRVRLLKSQWGSCHWRKRLLTFNVELARASREAIEYIVVHELTHLQAHDHGPRFYQLMSERLPQWQVIRR